jgi:hypothetical protein
MCWWGIPTVPAIALSMAAFGASPAGAVSSAQLKAKTLSLADLPAGWSVDRSPPGGASNLGGCLQGLAALKKTPPKGVVRAHVSYTMAGGFPGLQETIEAGKGEPARFNKYLRTIAGCKNISFTGQGVHYTGTVSALAVPTVGNSSHAYNITIAAGGQSIGIDIVLFRAGQYGGEIVYGDYTPATSTLQAFATEAVNKIEGKPVGPPASV